MSTVSYFREKAAHCLQLADCIYNDNDPMKVELLALAKEFEQKAMAIEAEDGSD